MKTYGWGIVATIAAAGFVQGAAASNTAPTNCFSSLAAFLDATPADCPLRWNGVTLYGAVDMGVGHSSHGAALNHNYPQGVQEVIAKFSKGPMWQLVPNGLQRSNVGLSANWTLAPGWSFVGNVNTDFDPYSLRLANGPASLVDNNAKTLARQSANGDPNRAGQFDNTQGYVGVSSPVSGTLTVGRVNSFSADLVTAYDAMQGAYAFSLIGNSAAYVSGVGDTETARYESAVKCVWSGPNMHAGAAWRFGGYSLGNGADGAVQRNLGATMSRLSVDAVYSYARDAVALSLYGVNPLPAGVGPADLKATLADIQGGLLAAKYDIGPLKLYGGYEYAVFAPPSNTYPGGFSSLGGYAVLPSAVNTTAYLNNRNLQVGWIGARYALRDNLDLAGAYYLVHQNGYAPPGAKANACGPNTIPAIRGAKPQGAFNSYCAGQLQAFSALLEYKPYKKIDIYGGFMYPVASGGLASGYIHNANFAPTAGLRISF
jgi:predicted porin